MAPAFSAQRRKRTILSTSAFTEEVARQLPGPAWLTARRAAAYQRFVTTAMPTEREEEWRYSDIDAFDLDHYVPITNSLVDGGETALATELIERIGHNSGVIRTVNGRIASIELAPAATKQELVVEPWSQRSGPPSAVGVFEARRTGAFDLLADAFGADAVVVTVPQGCHLDAPVVVVHEVVPQQNTPAVFPRLVLQIGASSSASVIEVFVSSVAPCLVIPTTEIDVDDNANFSYHCVQLLGRNSVQLGTQWSRVGRDATFASFVAAFGGDYARMSIDSDLVGTGANSQLLALYFGNGKQVQDFRTHQNHGAAHTKSELIFKGAVDDLARSVYTGTIHIERGAVKSNAAQTNRNLVLSEGAHADSVPNLDIEENDVRCTHASAVGPVDPEQRFYLESRGVPGEVADRLILLGFFRELFERVPERSIAAYLDASLADLLSKSNAPVEAGTGVLLEQSR